MFVAICIIIVYIICTQFFVMFLRAFLIALIFLFMSSNRLCFCLFACVKSFIFLLFEACFSSLFTCCIMIFICFRILFLISIGFPFVFCIDRVFIAFFIMLIIICILMLFF